MNLLFCIDRGFIPLLGTCVRSILKNGGYERYEAYVLHSDLTQADQAAIRRFGGERMHFTFLTVQEELFEGFPSSERYPRQIYYRLIAPLLLPRDMERILYLDRRRQPPDGAGDAPVRRRVVHGLHTCALRALEAQSGAAGHGSREGYAVSQLRRDPL